MKKEINTDPEEGFSVKNIEKYLNLSKVKIKKGSKEKPTEYWLRKTKEELVKYNNHLLLIENSIEKDIILENELLDLEKEIIRVFKKYINIHIYTRTKTKKGYGDVYGIESNNSFLSIKSRKK